MTTVYSVCETVSAVVTHARIVGDEGLVYGGGLYAIHGKTALCGAEVAWDTRSPVRSHNVTCRHCRASLEEQT
jgi:hypothetical protein